MNIYRALLNLNRPHGEHKNDATIIQELGIYSPLTMVVYMRIQFLRRLLIKGSPALWHLMLVNSTYKGIRSWLNVVLDSLNRLAECTDKLSELKGADLMTWLQFIKGHDKQFGKLIIEATASDTVNAPMFWWPKTKAAYNKINPLEPNIFTCEESGCSFTCQSVTGMNWHMYDKHGQRQLDRHTVDTTHCMCCLQEFHTRERVMTHISASSKRCQVYYRMNAEPVHPEVLAKLDSEALTLTNELKKKGKRRTYAQQPPLRLDGPLTAEAYEAGVSFSHLLKCPPVKPKKYRLPAKWADWVIK